MESNHFFATTAEGGRRDGYLGHQYINKIS